MLGFRGSVFSVDTSVWKCCLEGRRVFLRTFLNQNSYQVEGCSVLYAVFFGVLLAEDSISFFGRLLTYRVLRVGEFRVIGVIIHAFRD